MAWVKVKKENDPFIATITKEVFEGIYKLQGYKIVEEAQKQGYTAQNEVAQTNTQPKAEIPPKRQYTKRNSVSDNK